MGQVFSLALGAAFGYMSVCAGLVLYYLPSVRSQSAVSWWREQLTFGGPSMELLGLLACVGLAGYILAALYIRHPVLKSLVAMTLAVVGALHYPLGDLRRPDIALFAQWHLSLPFIVGPAIVVLMLSARSSDDDVFRRRLHRWDPWLKKIGYFRKR